MWLLRGARVACNAMHAELRDLAIGDGIIRQPEATRSGASQFDERSADVLDLSGLMILPGLINAHDHLEFSLFPRLGRGRWPDASAWARDIYRPEESPVREHLRVPKATRLAWGGLRNLLSGVTTVCHHNPYETAVFEHDFPVRVVQRFGWAHSLDFSPDLAERFRRTPADWPFLVHVAETVNGSGAQEIHQLKRLGALDGRTVLVHAVGLDRGELRVAAEAGAAIVWCPSSNMFALGRTLDHEALHGPVRVALGTDSPLTADGDLIDELRVAGELSGLAAEHLYRMVTEQPARMLRLNGGRLKDGQADLIAVRDRGETPAGTLLRLDLQMVMIAGEVKLISLPLASQLPPDARRRLHRLTVEGRGTYMVNADIPSFYEDAARVLGTDIRLGGKRVCL
jgi:cytosine/adenosine deaminase-related metal-dependent hydrolase